MRGRFYFWPLMGMLWFLNAGAVQGQENAGLLLSAAAQDSHQMNMSDKKDGEGFQHAEDAVEPAPAEKRVVDEVVRQTLQIPQIGTGHGQESRAVPLSHDNTGLHLCLAINYGGRTELVDAARDIAERVRSGKLDPAAIDDETLSSALYTAGMRDPDLLIRTAGEMRVSNFLLWQISYAELWVTPKCWPDFDRATLVEALRDFAGRTRRFGGLKG